jgi:hypothetical protein
VGFQVMHHALVAALDEHMNEFDNFETDSFCDGTFKKLSEIFRRIMTHKEMVEISHRKMETTSHTKFEIDYISDKLIKKVM